MISHHPSSSQLSITLSFFILSCNHSLFSLLLSYCILSLLLLCIHFLCSSSIYTCATGLEIGPLFDGPTRPRPGQELLMPARPDFYSIRAEPGPPSPPGQFTRPARPGPVQDGTIISNSFYKKDFHTMELNDHFSNLSEHCERFIIMAIIS